VAERPWGFESPLSHARVLDLSPLIELTLMAVDQTDIQVSLVEGDGWNRTLTVTVSSDRVTRTRSAETRRVSRTKRLKGFRKGKIPLAVVEQQFGAEIDERVQQRLLDEGYREALDQQDLTPAGRGRITDVKYGADEPFVFQAELEVMPTVRLDKLGGFKLDKTVTDVADGEVEQIFERIREENANWTEVDRQPAKSDRVTVRITPLADEAESQDGPGTQYQVVIGSGEALEDVEQAITTLSPGNERIFSIDFPDESSQGDSGDDESGATVTRRLHIQLESVEERDLPELDDELVSTLGAFETVDDLETAVREDLARHHESEAEGKLRTELMAAVVTANPFVVPRALLDRYIHNMLQAPEELGAEELERARETVGSHAEQQIREQLILDKIIETQELEPSPEDVEAEIEAAAARRKVSTGQLRKELARDGSLEALGRNLAVENAFSYLKDQSGIS
jgi:trigger factor